MEIASWVLSLRFAFTKIFSLKSVLCERKLELSADVGPRLPVVSQITSDMPVVEKVGTAAPMPCK